jgi:hypothetical protein
VVGLLLEVVVLLEISLVVAGLGVRFMAGFGSLRERVINLILHRVLVVLVNLENLLILMHR